MERARAENQRLGIMLLTTLLLMLSYTTRVSQGATIKTYAVVIAADSAVDSYRDLELNSASSQIHATINRADLTNGQRTSRDISRTLLTRNVPVGNGTNTTKRPPLTTTQPTTVKAGAAIFAPIIRGNETNPTENSTIHSSSEAHSNDGTKTTPPLTENSTAKRTTNGPITSTATPTHQISTSPTLPATPLRSGHNDNNSSTESPTTAVPTDSTNKRTLTNAVIEDVTDPSTPNITQPIEFSTVHNTSSPIVPPSTPPTNSTGPITSTTTTTPQNSTSPPLPTTPQPSNANLTEFTTTKSPTESSKIGALIAAVAALPLIYLSVLLLICCICCVAKKCQPRQKNPANHELGIRKPLIGNTNATGIRNQQQYHITEGALCVHVC